MNPFLFRLLLFLTLNSSLFVFVCLCTIDKDMQSLIQRQCGHEGTATKVHILLPMCFVCTYVSHLLGVPVRLGTVCIAPLISFLNFVVESITSSSFVRELYLSSFSVPVCSIRGDPWTH